MVSWTAFCLQIYFSDVFFGNTDGEKDWSTYSHSEQAILAQPNIICPEKYLTNKYTTIAMLYWFIRIEGFNTLCTLLRASFRAVKKD
jgi:hypothetical protein